MKKERKQRDFRYTPEQVEQDDFRYAFDQTEQECEVRETSAYKEDEELKTIEDYYALPDDERVELIDGRFYAMSAPTVNHQAWVVELLLLFRKYIDEKEGKCEVYIAPCDVRLDKDDYTMVQPDLMICCSQDQVTFKRIEGAPDFVLEVTSQSSVYLDRHKKLQKYRDADVREYWIVDPQKETVTVYHFEKSGEPMCYTFADMVPVGIYSGDCKIDFAQIRKRLSYFDEKRR